MPKKIKNMGTATMRFNEGLIASASIDSPDVAFASGVAILCSGTLEISDMIGAGSDRAIRILSSDSDKSITFQSQNPAVDIGKIQSTPNMTLIVSGNEGLYLESGMVLINSGGASSSPDPENFLDTSFFISGTIGSMGTEVKGTSVFGGDLHVSGAAQINTVTVTEEGKVGIGTTSPAHKLEVGGNMSVGEKIMHRNDTDTFIQFPGAEDQINMAAGNINFFKIIKESSAPHISVFNDDGSDIDVHFKAQGGDDLLKLDASDGKVGIGMSSGSPNELLTIDGIISLKEGLAPESNDNGYGKIYTKSSDGALYFKNDEGDEFNLLNASYPWTRDGTNVYLTDSNDNVGIGTSSPDTKLEIVHTGQPQSDLSDRTQYHLLLTHVMGTHDNSFDNSIGIGFNARESVDADEIGAAIVHVQSGSNDVGNLSFYVKGKIHDTADPTLVMVMSASRDDRGGRVSINSPQHYESVIKWPLEVTNYVGNASPGAKTCLRITGELDNTGVDNFGSGARMRFAVRESGDETEDMAAISAIQDTATTAGKLQFATRNMGASDPTTKMTISQEGFVGIGIDNPDTPLHIQSSSGAPGGLLRLLSIFSSVYWDIFIGNPNGRTLYFKYNGGDNGGYLSADADVEDINFTGQHRAYPGSGVASDYADKIGMIVVSGGEYNNLANSDGKPSISESVPVVMLSSQRNQKSVFGVVADVELESENERKFEQGAFVTTFSKPNNDERLMINGLGEGGIWICNINGKLENGDYITTCEIPGLGMRQDDDILHNYTVAKITQDCDFDISSNKYETIVFTHNGIEYKKSFVGCTYHCG